MPAPPPILPFAVLGIIAAGFPSPAEGYEDQALDLHAYLVRHPAATFFFKVQGDALKARGILHGAVLVVDRSEKPAMGRLVIVESDGDFAVVPCQMIEDVIHGVVVASAMRFR